MRKAIVLWWFMLSMLLVATPSLAKSETLVRQVAFQNGAQFYANEVAYLTYTIELDALEGKKNATIALPEGVVLQSKSNQTIRDNSGQEGTIHFDTKRNEFSFIFGQAPSFYADRTLDVHVPVKVKDTSNGKTPLTVQTTTGEKLLTYTILQKEHDAKLSVQGEVDGKIIHWKVVFETNEQNYRNVQFTNRLSEEQQLVSPVNVLFYNEKTATKYEEDYNVRLTNAHEMKMNIGSMERKKITITYDTTVTSYAKTSTSDVTISASNQPAISANGKVTGVALTEEKSREQSEDASDLDEAVEDEEEEQGSSASNASTSNSPSSSSTEAKVTTKDEAIIVQNDEEQTLNELPQTGQRDYVVGGLLLFVSGTWLLKRRMRHHHSK